MKIIIFTDSFLPLNSGVVTYTINIANILTSRGHKIILFVPKPKEKIYPYKKLNRKIKIYYFKGIPAFFYPTFRITNILSFKDIKIVKKINPDILYFQTPFTLGLKAVMLSKITKKPLVGIFHTHLASEEYLSILGNIYNKINLKKLSWKYLRYFYNNCSIVISPSKYMARELKKNKIKRKIVIINNFIYKDILENKNSKLKVNKNSFVYIGRISKEKNIKLLIDAFRRVISVRDSYLYIVGDGPEYKSIKSYIAKNHLTERIIMTGNIDNDILLKTNFLRKFNAFITMSNSEVQPISIIEAMSKGLPIIGPKSRGITEMITTNGILIKRNSVKEMSDAIIKIIDKKNLRKKMSEESLKIFNKKYNSEESIKKLEKIFFMIKNIQGNNSKTS
ncbi:MAG: glycosyltransferase [Candidatus Woesearchaeota archaeon]